MKPTVFSYTRLSAFDQCQHKYVQRYCRKFVPKYEGIEAFVGKRVHEVVEDVERSLIERELERCGGNKTKVAEALGLSRLGLRNKIQRYGL